MEQPLCRYYIELCCDEAAAAPRSAEGSLRRKRADDFVRMVEEWADESDFHDEIKSLQVTPLGQVAIVCSQRVIQCIRGQDVAGIASIRDGSQYTTTMSRRIGPMELSTPPISAPFPKRASSAK